MSGVLTRRTVLHPWSDMALSEPTPSVRSSVETVIRCPSLAALTGFAQGVSLDEGAMARKGKQAASSDG